MNLKVLIACEEIQTICKEFRRVGHNAFSCDIQECSGGHPEWHIKGDVLDQLNKDWDLIIAHPPCTYLSNAGARWLFPNKVLNKERYEKGLDGKDFFMKLLNAKCKRVVVENPTPSKIYNLPECTQVIQPYYFGDDFMKRTCLWIKGLPNLKHKNPKTLKIPEPLYVMSNGKKAHFTDAAKGGKNRAKERSKTFPGIAKAMVEQWSKYILEKLKEDEE